MPKQRKQRPVKNPWGSLVWYFLIAAIVILLGATYFNSNKAVSQLDFTQFMKQVGEGRIQEVTVNSGEKVISGKTKDGKIVKTFFLDYPDFVKELRAKNVKINVAPTDSGWMGVFIQTFLPFIFIGGLWFFIFRQAQGANNQAMSFGKSKATMWDKKDKQAITFKDVAGVDEAVQEVNEIVDFLKLPQKYLEIGAKIPKGVLLMGPPGTGKTLLAKAIAGEADVPFFSLSGSDFVEMFVGVGASRVRDLFNQAKKSQPCIIFLDEIDAVGRQRGAGMGGGHDEREQTLNQLLVEMDGFDPKQTVIVIAATNRPDILDPALLRPGRFDRQVVVDKPDIKGREDILKIHAKGKKMGDNVDLEVIARRTPGFTGADLANLVNEAALLAARHNKKTISMTELEEATDRVMAGPERKSRLLSAKEKEIVAYHEVGHALVAKHCLNADPVHKISILPRGMALGYTLQLPIEDRHLLSRTEILDKLKVLMGGRIAEELTFGEITSGASNDIERATEMARNYVCKFGMSPTLGARKYGKTQEHVFLGRDYTSDHTKDYSEETAREIDLEIKKLIDTAYGEATKILTDNKDKLAEISAILMDKEVIEAEEFKTLLA
ncbi:MAG: ATP-dependent zinc metalloprotease FtsH [Candidatus Margulisiibacteriota bacterium]